MTDRTTPFAWVRYWRYRTWSLFIHRFNYHHMELSFPEGDVIAWCRWCGLRDELRRAATEDPR